MKFNILGIRPHDTVSQLERDHAAAVLNLATTEAAFETARQNYDESLGNGKDAALAARRARGEAEVDCDLARHSLKQIADRLKVAHAAAVAAEAERLKAEALKRIRDLEVTATRELKTMASAARRIIRLRAEAELAREAAINAGVSEVDLPDVEDFRNTPTLPEKIVESTRTTRWIHPRTLQPLDDAQSRGVVTNGLESYLGSDIYTRLDLKHQEQFNRITLFPARRGQRAESFISTLNIPGVMADDVPGWSSMETTDPREVIAQLDVIENASPPDRSDCRQSEIVLRAL